MSTYINMGCFIFFANLFDSLKNYSTLRLKNKFPFKYSLYSNIFERCDFCEQNYRTKLSNYRKLSKINITQLTETRTKEQKFVSEFNENRIRYGIHSNCRYWKARALKVRSYLSHLCRYVKLLLALRFSHWLMVHRLATTDPRSSILRV